MLKAMMIITMVWLAQVHLHMVIWDPMFLENY